MAGSCHFPTDATNFRRKSRDNCKFLTKENMGVQNIILSRNFSKIVLALNFAFLNKIFFQQEKKIFHQLRQIKI